MVSRNPSCVGSIIYNINYSRRGSDFSIGFQFRKTYQHPPLTVHDRWAGGIIYNPRTRDHGSGVIRLQLPLVSQPLLLYCSNISCIAEFPHIYRVPRTASDRFGAISS